MSLTNHDYFFVSERNEFYKMNQDTFQLIKQAVIEQVYAVWDCMNQKWFDETQNSEINGLNWVEDLEWREYSQVQQICNEQIESILFHPCNGRWGVGIGLKCKSNKCLWIYDAGDVISAKVV